MRVRGGELVVRALEAEGVRFTFGIPGTHNTELYDAMVRSRVRPVLVTSELAASFLADGVSRTSDQVGVLTVVPGAGVTHALSGIAEAFMDCVPLVVIACGIRSDTGTSYQLHAIDQLAVLAPVTKAAWRVEHADEIVPRVRRAFALARSGTPGPVAVEIPANLLLLTQEVAEPALGPPPDEEPPAPDEAVITEVVGRLAAAQHPALYVGLGAVGAAERLPELAERLGAPVTTTFQGKGVFPESHPLWLWNGFGPQAPRFVDEIMASCDCLLAIGCRFSEVATGSYGLRPPANMIHVDINPDVFGRNFPAAVTVEADAGRFVRALLPRLGGPRDAGEVTAAIAAGHRRVSAKWADGSSRGRVSPARLLAGLQRHCAADTVYTTDSGNGTFLAMEHLRLQCPGCFIGPVDFSCMGYAVPAAIGASLANPGRDVVALAGDGALLMTGLELVAAAANGATPIVVVLRDGKLGQIAQFQKIPLNRQTCTVLPPFEIADLARATRCRYFNIADDAALDSVLPLAVAAARAGQPVMVEAAVDYSHLTYFTRGVVKTNFWRLPWGERLRMLGRALGRRVVGSGP